MKGHSDLEALKTESPPDLARVKISPESDPELSLPQE